MRVLGQKQLFKLRKKNTGNRKLIDAIDALIEDLEVFDPKRNFLPDVRDDADCVHSDGFYFFNINVHRAFVLIDLDDDEATIIWAGSHDEYERTFRNNKSTIKKWLRINGYIDR